jgi:hypothetical protein
LIVTTDSFFALACVSLIALFFGSILALNGYRFFMILLPIWGFFFGFGVGAQAIQAIFGTGFLSDITSWVVGFVVALIFAVLSYLFYFFAVALIAGSLGYALGIGVMMAIMPNLGFIGWMIGIVVGVVFAIGVTVLNIQKWVVIIATSLLGAGVIVGALLLILGQLPSSEVVANPVQSALQSSPFWMIFFVIVALGGIAAQFVTTRRSELEEYNRWEDYYGSEASA